jgi:outer membrane protein assembly factor BamB/tRNA A-37 threonylcarbamoyl transferase component Bud32
MTSESSESSREQRVNEVIADYLRAADAGRAPDRTELLARHADLADQLRSFFTEHDRAGRLATSPAEAPTLAPAEAPADPAVGAVRYFGDYELLAEVARGGMGVVYKARQVSLNRVVALKMILSGQLAGPEDVQRFRLEAQTAAGLQHPNIVAIHEVGEHQGQHYFSMDLVEGQSLADLVRNNPLPPEQAARWVRAVALAIQYAHERGVLHRDLKPSNVLIDQFGQPRVTDFGLAKRIDKDAGLTATGAVVGTPSYMPPEQASGQRGAMGPASDVYSLGAVLYELVTGRPPFRAATPLDTLMQVLDAEPAPPRLLNPAVGRDLETIILKCLQKESARRYVSAQELADDLGALLEGRPIKARRPGLAERALRWAQTQRRTAAVIVLSAAAATLLLLGGTLGWRAYEESRLGRVTLNTPDTSFRAEILDNESRLVVKPFPTSLPEFDTEPVSLPAGDYELSLSTPDARGEVYQLLVQPGTKHEYTFTPESRRLWEPLRLKKGEYAEPFEVNGRADFFVIGPTRLLRKSGATLDVLNDWGPGMLAETVAGRQPGFRWHDLIAQRPGIVRPAPVVDGEPLLVLASRATPSLVAVSGKVGRLLWWHRTGPAPAPGERDQFLGQVLGDPIVTALDGRPVLVTTFGTGQARSGEPWLSVEAIDAATGRPLWPQPHMTEQRVLDRPTDLPDGTVGVLPADGGPVVAVMAGRRLAGLDLRTGQLRWSHDLEPLIGAWDNCKKAPPRFGLFGNPPEPGVLLSFDAQADPSRTTTDSHPVTVAAVSLRTGRLIWRHELTVGPAFSRGSLQDGPILEASGGGAADVILVYGDPETQFSDRVIELLDGHSGARRWRYAFPTLQTLTWLGSQWAQVTVGPDLDGDGRREVLVASAFGSSLPQPVTGQPGTYTSGLADRLCVEALSGADGRPLWRWLHPYHGSPKLGPLLEWRQPGADGWPHLLVPLVLPDNTPGPTFVLSEGTGKLTQVFGKVSNLRHTDLDGDGIPDLLGDAPDGSIVSMRGVMPEAWRRLGPWQPAGDLDGDGIPDAVSSIHSDGGDEIAAVSGKDGRCLWALPTRGQFLLPLPKAYADIDGDGIPDLVLLQAREGLSALSGRTGRPIWKDKLRGGDYPLPAPLMLASRRLERDGSPVLLFAYEATLPPGLLRQLMLAVLSLKDGRTLWQTALGPRANSLFNVSVGGPSIRASAYFSPVLADLDGDGVLDVVTWAATDDGAFEVRALRGQDGTLLWRQPLSRPVRDTWPFPALAVGEVDGRPLVVVDCGTGEVLAFDGAHQGEPLWRWKVPVDNRQGAFGFLQGRATRPAPVFLNLAGGGHGVCVSGLMGEQAVVLDVRRDATQRELQRVGGLWPVRQDRFASAVCPVYFADLASGSAAPSALVSIREGTLRLTRGGIAGRHQEREWRVTGAWGGIQNVLGEGERATVVVSLGNTAVGLDGATLGPRWRCVGPCPPTGLLPGLDPAAPPLVLFAQAGGATSCRRALEVEPDGRYRQPTPVKIVPRPLRDDPRLFVPLPWSSQQVRTVPSYLWLGLLVTQATLAVAALVGWSAVWVLRRGAWILGLLLSVLLAAVLFLGLGLYYLLNASRFIAPVHSVMAEAGNSALFGLPALVFLWRALVWTVQGRWRRVGLLLAASVLLTLPLAGVMLWNDRLNVGPGRHYVAEGWYAAWLLGAYMAGLLLMLELVLRAAYRVVRGAGRWVYQLFRPAKAMPTAA